MEICYSNFTELYGNEIARVLKYKKEHYRSFSIPKKNGSKRSIEQPLTPLKELQKALNRDIFNPMSYLINKCACAYMPGSDIKECVEKHVGKEIVVKMDIKDFFGSISKKLVMESLRYALRMDDGTAQIIAELCTLNGVLPQGAPTSPMLSNYVCRILDRRLCNYCADKNITYSRYADDLIFSGDNFDIKALIGYTAWALRNYYGFELNYDKLHIMYRHQRQVVLGVLVNEKCRLTKEKRRELRQALYYIKKYGIEDYFGFTGKMIRSLQGYVNYALQICEEPFVRELEKEIMKQKNKAYR